MKKPLFLAVFAAAALFCSAASFAAPAQVIFIRHAEKPGNSNELSEKGFRRAQALVKFFLSDPAVNRYGPPAAIYAAAPKHEDSSIRSIQTVTPLAKAVQVRISKDFTRGETRKLARSIMQDPAYDGKMVLVCWQHAALVDAVRDLAEESGAAQKLLGALPVEWPDETFDRAWILDFDRGSAAYFRNIPQRLLPGDSVK
jgi:hypothetical protein